jgi:hypothetical protein
MIEYNNHENFSKILSFFNIKYIIIDKTLNSTASIHVYKYYGAPFIEGNPELFEKFMDEEKILLKISETNEFSIYQNTFYMPYLSLVKLAEITERANYQNCSTNLISNGNFSEGIKYWEKFTNPGDSILIMINETISPSLLVLRQPNNTLNSVLTQTVFNVTPGSKYKISGWMRKENTKGSHIKVAWFGDYNLTEKNALRHDVVKTILKRENSWLYFEDIFISPKNATIAVLYLVAGPSADGNSLGKTWFADLKMEKLLTIEQLFTYQDENNKLHLISNLTENYFTPINNYHRDKSNIFFKVNITEPSLIVMGESYDENWVAYINDQRLLHWRANGWANGFLIPNSGEYEVKIIFQSQMNRDLMIKIWLIAWSSVLSLTFASSLFYLFYDWRRSKKDKWALALEKKISKIIGGIKNAKRKK